MPLLITVSFVIITLITIAFLLVMRSFPFSCTIIVRFLDIQNVEIMHLRFFLSKYKHNQISIRDLVSVLAKVVYNFCILSHIKNIFQMI